MDDVRLAAIWEQVLKKLEHDLSKLVFDTWIKPTIPLSITETTLELGTPKQIMKEWLESRYLPVIINAVQSVTKSSLTIQITNLNLDVDQTDTPAEHETDQVLPEKKPISAATSNYTQKTYQNITENQANSIFSHTISPVPMQRPPETEVKQPQFTTTEESLPLNPKYIFETFVIGNSNRFAHAASLAVAEAPAQVYNPFFI